MDHDVGIAGFGFAVPPSIRLNDDPLFAEIRAAAGVETDFFSGAVRRRFLADGEAIEDFMVQAGSEALEDAGVPARAVDRIYGYSFVSEYLTPNGLYKVHQGLGLRRDAMVVPINAEYSNFIIGLVLAWEAIAAGHIDVAMVNCGASMTRYMDYGRGHAAPVGDGAGAVIVSRTERYRFVDHEVVTLSDMFDVMTMKVRPIERHGARFLPVDSSGAPMPTYEIKEDGLRVVSTVGVDVPPALVQQLLSRNGVPSDRVTLVAHQASRPLMERWEELIAPAEYADTFDEFGNVTIASIPITLAKIRSELRSDYIVLLSPGTGTSMSALLMQR